MATTKQVAANRRNALKSTGPVTPEGKATSSLNASRHGLLATKVVLSNEDRDEFETFSEQCILALQPIGEIEALLADRIIMMTWRLRRTSVIEKDLFKKDLLESHFPTSIGERFQNRTAAFSVLSRYEAGIERSLFRALHEFQRIQAFRNGIVVPLPVAIDIQSSEETPGK
jgi:hypothetical protein